MKCKTCGADIVFDYVTPSKSFQIKDGKIERDDAWKGIPHDDPYLEFYCSNDKDHDIESEEALAWTEMISEQFYDGGNYI